MHVRQTALTLFALGMTAGSASAQKPATLTAVAPAPAIAPQTTPAAPSTAVVAPPAAAPPTAATPEPVEAPLAASPSLAAPSSRIACVIGDHPREFPDSARTATGLVCDALRQHGVDVGAAVESPAGAGAAYVVSLEQLGSIFYLRVSYEEPIGVAKKTRRMSIYGLEEAEVAAPRIASAMLDTKTTDETIAYDNVVGSEQRQYAKKTGEFVVGAGLAALSTPSAGTYMGPAFHLFGFYETRNWGIGIQGHIGDAAMHPNQTSFFSAFSVGARYFFSDEDLTPLIGGGLALSDIAESKNSEELKGSGTSAYLEAGIEAFRLHKTHFIATLRVDAPFYTLSPNGDYYYAGSSVSSAPALPKDRYEVPFLLNVGVGF